MSAHPTEARGITSSLARTAPGRFARAIASVAGFTRSKPLGAFGGLLVLIVVLAAGLAPFLTTYNPIQVQGEDRLFAPSSAHPFGTDSFGRDVFARVVFGAQTSLYVGFLSVALCTAAAAIVGILSGYIGGMFDDLVQRVVDAVMALPFLILMLTIMMLLGASATNVGLALGALFGIRNSRVVRAAVISVRENQYMEAARAIGAPDGRVLLLYVLPNIFGPLMVIATITWGAAVLAESQLSFLGFGVPPPYPSWGRMVSEDGRRFLEKAPWIAFFPGVAISISVFGFNMLGDAMRDALDPRMRGSR